MLLLINSKLQCLRPKLNTLKDKLIGYIPVGLCFWLNQVFYLAATTELGKGITKATDNIVDEIVAVYCGSLFYALLIVNIIVLAFSKNDKVTGIAKKTIIFIVVAFLAGKYIQADKLNTTMDTVTDWLTN